MNRSHTSTARSSVATVIGLVLIVTACGGGSDDSAPTAGSQVASAESIAPIDTPATEPAPSSPPATEPPVTEPPATDPPATEPPATEPPATEPPATDPPVTEPPATDPPATDPPAEIGPPIVLGDDDMPAKFADRAAIDLTGAAEVTDFDGRINLFVPNGWTDVRTVPDDAASQITVSSDVDQFFGSIDRPGVLVQLDDVAPGTGISTSAEQAMSLAATFGNGTCTEREQNFYVGGALLGGEIVLACIDGFDTRILGLGATGGDDDRSIIIVLINPTGDTSANELVLDTLLVGP